MLTGLDKKSTTSGTGIFRVYVACQVFGECEERHLVCIPRSYTFMADRIWRMSGLVRQINEHIGIGRRLQRFSTAAESLGATHTTHHSAGPAPSLGLHAQLDPLFDENEGIFVLSLTR